MLSQIYTTKQNNTAIRHFEKLARKNLIHIQRSSRPSLLSHKSKMAAAFRTFRQKFSGFTDILIGVLVGAGVTKVYYETTGDISKDSISSNQKEIQKIVQNNANLRYGKHLRTIDLTSSQDGIDSVDSPREFYKYGVPQSPLRYLQYTNHWVCYDQAKKIPLWVAEHLTREKVQGGAQRDLSVFTSDQNIPAEFQSRNEDFLGTGWSRGHLAPAGDNKFNQDAMNETFFLSNVVPQNLDNNANFWYRLESYCRTLTKRYSDVYVVSGPLFLPSNSTDGNRTVQYEVIGNSHVAVPTHLFKVMVAENKNKQPLIGAFVVPNQPITNNHQLTEFEVTMEMLSKHTGMSFFSETLTSNAGNLCKVDGCKLLSKEFMENILLGRKLRNSKSTEELENLWKDAAERGVIRDSFMTRIYNEKKETLKQFNETVDR